MKMTGRKQQSGSALVNIIVLLAVGYGVYVGIQYAPIFIESRTVDAILNNIHLANDSAKLQSRHAVETLVDRELTVNGMSHMRDRFTIQRMGDGYQVSVQYERPFNVLYEVKTLKLNKSLQLQ